MAHSLAQTSLNKTTPACRYSFTRQEAEDTAAGDADAAGAMEAEAAGAMVGAPEPSLADEYVFTREGNQDGELPFPLPSLCLAPLDELAGAGAGLRSPASF